jgi:hypothetical protein
MTSPRALLTAWNIQAKKQLGQNFLNDPNVARAIVNKAGIAGDDVVLEIGPGLGAMTVPPPRPPMPGHCRGQGRPDHRFAQDGAAGRRHR